MSTVADIMTPGCTCVGEGETVQAAARAMRDQDIGSLPICGDDNRLKGMLTDRDIVVKCVAEGGNCAELTAGELAQGTPLFVQAGSTAEEAVAMMRDAQVRRLPVIDGKELVGIVAQADLARALSRDQHGAAVEGVSAK